MSTSRSLRPQCSSHARIAARRALAACAACAWLATASPARAERDPTTVGDVSLGFASGLCTLVYTPLKIVYATGGVVVAGLVFVFSAGNTDTTAQVLRVTAGGDYVVAPEHLRGTRVLRVTGV